MESKDARQQLDADDLRRRLRAARALTAPTPAELGSRPGGKRKRNPEPGITIAELAQRLAEPGLGEKTLGAIQRGERTAQRRDLIVIAEALDLPLAFFTVSRSELLERLADAGAPPVPGELGRQLRDRQPTEEDRELPESRDQEGRQHAARE